MVGPVTPQHEIFNKKPDKPKPLPAWKARFFHKLIFRLLNYIWKREGEWSFIQFSEFHIDRRHDFRVYLTNYDPAWAKKHGY